MGSRCTTGENVADERRSIEISCADMPPERAREVRPEDSTAAFYEGQALQKTGDLAGARDALEAIQVDWTPLPSVIGLVNAVHPAAQLAEATQDVANELTANAPLSIRAAKAAIDALAHPSAGVDLTDIDALVHACFESDDYAEGRRAFAEKRKPAFKGR